MLTSKVVGQFVNVVHGCVRKNRMVIFETRNSELGTRKPKHVTRHLRQSRHSIQSTISILCPALIWTWSSSLLLPLLLLPLFRLLLSSSSSSSSFYSSCLPKTGVTSSPHVDQQGGGAVRERSSRVCAEKQNGHFETRNSELGTKRNMLQGFQFSL